jgi:hypothetical protein
MRGIKIAGLMMVVVLALAASTTPAADAAEFIASKEGKITGKALNTQEFKTGGDPTVKCTGATPSGEVAAGKLKETEIKISVILINCSVAFGTATVTLADYTLFAVPGVSILNATGSLIMIHAEALGVKCTISVTNGQTLGKAAGEIEYVNKAGKVEEKNKVKGIASEITESNSSSLCGTVGEKLTGEHTGNIEVELEGGTIEVK